MAGEEPVRHPIDDVETLAAQAREPGEDLIDKAPQGAREVSPDIALEIVPFPLLLAQLRAAPGQPDDVQPPRPLSQRGLARLARVAGAMVEGQEDLAPGRAVAPVQGVEVELECRRILGRADHLHPAAAEDLDAPEGGHPPIRPRGREGRLDPDPMPDPIEDRICLQVGLVLMMELVDRRLLGYFFSAAANSCSQWATSLGSCRCAKVCLGRPLAKRRRARRWRSQLAVTRTRVVSAK